MRFAGQNVRFLSHLLRPAAVFAALAGAFGLAPLHAQQAPYVLPYTMSTFAGPHAAYTAGAACGSLVALDTQGDGCLAPSVSVGTDPHDIRVDPRGFVYWIDNAAVGLIHRINLNTQQETIFVGSPTQSKACSAAVDTYGDSCPANDGAANNNAANLTTSTKFKSQRGIAVAPNGDLYSAGYNDYNIHKVSAATGIFSVVAGVIGTTTAVTVANTGPAVGTAIGSSRGVGVDAAGNVYIADTGANVIQEVTTAGQLILVTAANNSATKSVTSGVPANTALVSAPEDVQIDTNGNIYIDDAGNNVIRAIWMGKGTLPGITAPQLGFIYTIAGSGVGAVQGTYTYPTNMTSPTVLATSVAISPRKISLDSLNNLYIAEGGSSASGNAVVWFLDAQTGYMRDLAGLYGPIPSTTPTTCKGAADLNLGDGCPGYQAGLDPNSDMGTSPDNLGNLYITDAEGGVAANSRLRKLLSGLNFPAVATSVPTTQNIEVHFGTLDTPAATNPFTVTTGDFTLGTPACTLNADTTTDCVVPVTFKPTVAGYDTAVLTIKATTGGTKTYTLTGIGTASAIAIDPGYITSATSTSLSAPGNVVVDAQGNSYIADTGHNRILKVVNGTTTVFAGTGTAGYTGDAGLATAATLRAPTGIAFGIGGSIYIADTGNNVIRRVNLGTGLITTVAGGASTVCAAASNTRGDNCPALSATLNAPKGIVIDKLGQLYIADSGNNVIRQVATEISSTSNFIYTLAGGGTVCSAATDTQGDGCSATATTFNAPSALAYDQTGNYIVVADTGDNNIRRVYLANAISTTGTAGVATALVNPTTLLAGNGQAGSTVDSSSIATNSQLNAPSGVAVDAAENLYIADSGNSAIRLVNNGIIATIAGSLGAPGASTVPNDAYDVQLTTPSGVAVLPNGNLLIADTGNNRMLSDARNADTYSFGRLTPATQSSPQNFTVLSVGNAAQIFGSPVISSSTGNTADFTLVAASSSGCTAGQTLALGATCVLTGTFDPVAAASYSATYTIGTSTITLIGTGAYLTPTTSVVSQTAPATGNAQYGGSLTLNVTVTPSTCNPAAPSCAPTGTARITITNASGVATQYPSIALTANAAKTAASASEVFSGLAVGTYSVTCSYSGDGYYASSSCGATSITIAPATTTSTLTVSPTTTAQFGTAVLTATVVSSTIGVPTGTVTFLATNTSTSKQTTIGSANINATTGIATLTMSQTLTSAGLVNTDNTLPPGTYNLSCTYSGATNYAVSTCANVTFTVTPDAAALSIVTRGCAVSATAPTITGTPNQAQPCQPSHGSSPLGETLINGVPAVTTAQGSVTDAALFITPSDTVGGTLTFSCTGLPQYSTCTFSPTSISLTAGTSYVAPIPVDVTLWTDLQTTSANHGPAGSHQTNGVELATVLGGPLALLGFAGLFVTRKRFRNVRFLAAVPLAMLLIGGSLFATGCSGVGDYKANLTPAGQYPITITISGPNGLTKTTQVYFVVTSPGIPSIE